MLENSTSKVISERSTVPVEHLSKVRRAKVGDEIVAFNGDGYDYNLTICEITKDKVKNADILVVGSYITNSENYEEQIQKLKDR